MIRQRRQLSEQRRKNKADFCFKWIDKVFELPARVAHAQTMSGLTSAFENPQFSAAIGLIKYAQAVQTDRRPRRGFGRIFGKIFNGMRLF